MDELFPIAAGITLGLATQWIRVPQLRIITLLVISLLAGMLASFVSGELLVSWSFVALDIAEVGFAALATASLVVWFGHWRSTLR